MPDIVLACGQTVLVDDEDYDFVMSRVWYTRHRQDRSTTVIHDEFRANRRFRVFLHRAIGVRIKPDWAPMFHYVNVKAKNGDYCDVRRANLQILLQGQKRGARRYRPQGWSVAKRKWYNTGAKILDTDVVIDSSPLWAGGLVKTRTRHGLNDQRQRVATYAGRIIVDQDGQCRGDFLGDYERQQRLSFRRGGEPKGKRKVHVLGEDEGG